MFRAPLCPSSGAQEYYTVVTACGIWCCGFQVVGLVWSSRLYVVTQKLYFPMDATHLILDPESAEFKQISEYRFVKKKIKVWRG